MPRLLLLLFFFFEQSAPVVVPPVCQSDKFNSQIHIIDRLSDNSTNRLRKSLIRQRVGRPRYIDRKLDLNAGHTKE